jgi:predicted enzyme related to lactoylglutathione lyase
MKINEIAFTGYPVTDMVRARNFYEGVLGLEVSRIFGEGEKLWVEYDLGPETFAITNTSPNWKPSSDGASVALEVGDFDESIKELKEKEVPFHMEPFASPVCRLAIIADPDGNKLIIHKRNAS